jgi:hypothetical protein
VRRDRGAGGTRPRSTCSTRADTRGGWRALRVTSRAPQWPSGRAACSPEWLSAARCVRCASASRAAHR